MKIKSLRKKILLLKCLLNFLLLFLSPTNMLIVYLSEKLDNHVYKMQKHVYIRYKRRHKLTAQRSRVA